MFRCSNCSRLIEEGIIVKNHLTDDDFYVLEEVCPFCNNYLYEIEKEGEQDNN